MEGTKRIPLTIFDNMAGMKEVEPPKKSIIQKNVVNSPKLTPFNKTRLKNASTELFYFKQKELPSLLIGLFNYFQGENKISLSGSIVNEDDKENDDNNASVAKNLKKGIKIIKIIRKKLSSWASSLWKKIKNIIKTFKHIFNKIIKPFNRIKKLFKSKIGGKFKKVSNILKKIWNKTFNTVKRTARTIWNAAKKALPGKSKDNYKLPKEPPTKSMKAIKLDKKIKHKFGFKRLRNRTTYALKVFKNIIKPFAKVLKKIFQKVLLKPIKWVFKKISKMIVKFFARVAIGSILPGVGNIVMRNYRIGCNGI